MYFWDWGVARLHVHVPGKEGGAKVLAGLAPSSRISKAGHKKLQKLSLVK